MTSDLMAMEGERQIMYAENTHILAHVLTFSVVWEHTHMYAHAVDYGMGLHTHSGTLWPWSSTYLSVILTTTNLCGISDAVYITE